MIYNFNALESDSEEESESSTSVPMTEEDKKRKEIEKLQQIRDEKRKKLLFLTKSQPEEDIEHQNHIKELNKRALKLSRQTEERRKVADSLEIKLKSIPALDSALEPRPLSETEAQTEAIRNLRLQTDALTIELQKTKRALAMEGGNKGRAVLIKRLRQQVANFPEEDYDPNQLPTKSSGPSFDIPELRADIKALTDEQRSLKLKLRGLKSRLNVLNPVQLKASLKEKLRSSRNEDALIEKLRPKEEEKVGKKVQYKAHIAQQSRLSVMIIGLNQELSARTRELNHNETLQGEEGLTKEIERMQKRLHLLESSMSCSVTTQKRK